MKYIINVGNFTIDDVTYSNRCLSASFGGIGIQSEFIPWDSEGNPWDWEYNKESNSFAFNPIIIPEPTPVPTETERLEAQMLYTAMMTNTLIGE